MTEKRRQLNIRDDEIYELANAAAERMGVPTKEAVRAALKAYEPKATTSAGARARALKLAELEAMTARIAETAVRQSHADDDASLYDTAGLPR